MLVSRSGQALILMLMNYATSSEYNINVFRFERLEVGEGGGGVDFIMMSKIFKIENDTFY